MISLFLFILLIIGMDASQSIGSACVIEMDCVDVLTDIKSCILIGGSLANQTCTEMGFNVGTCCNLGNCFTSTMIPCLVGGGKWAKDGSCPCLEEPSSCCFGAECSEEFTEGDCLTESGTFFENRGCGSSVCELQEELKGACCDSLDRRCAFIPLEYCPKVGIASNWSQGITCEMKGCFPPEPIPILNENSTYPGRCCSRNCAEKDHADCMGTNILYEYGVGCNAYPCYPKGICIKKDYCEDGVGENLCYMIGGSYAEGGSCNAGELGTCTFKDNCNHLSESKCNAVTGDWVEGLNCPDLSGACCDFAQSECRVKKILKCEIGSGSFFPNQTCDEIDCGIGTCCVFEFCKEGVNEAYCLSLVGNPYYKYDACPSSGACAETINFLQSYFDIAFPIKVNNVEIKTANSSVNFTDVSLNEGKFYIANQSVIHFNTFKLSNSTMKIDGNSKLIIAGCFDASNSTVDIELSDLVIEDIKAGLSYTVASYQCLNGDLNINLNGKDTSCISATMGTTLMTLYMTEGCDDSTSVNWSSFLLPHLVVYAMYLSLN